MIYINNDYNILNPTALNIKAKLNWRELWIKKSDYIQKYYHEIKGKYNFIDESINYYITMTEMAIYYLKEYDNYYDYSYIQHKIILDNNYYNNKNKKEDVKERDFSEYLKYLFFYKKYNIYDVFNLIEKVNGKFNYDLIISRLLYPSYYFFYLDKLLITGMGEKEIAVIISRIEEYQNYVKLIVNKINEISTKKIVLPF